MRRFLASLVLAGSLVVFGVSPAAARRPPRFEAGAGVFRDARSGRRTANRLGLRVKGERRGFEVEREFTSQQGARNEVARRRGLGFPGAFVERS